MAQGISKLEPIAGGTPALPLTGQPGPLRSDEYRAPSIPNIVTFKTEHVEPPAGFYIQRDDQFILAGSAAFIATSIMVTLRILLAAQPNPQQPDSLPPPAPLNITGNLPIVTVQETLVLSSARNLQSISFSVAEGYLLSAAVTITGGNPSAGFTFARLSVTRGVPMYNNIGLVLCSGYVTQNTAISWPGGRVNLPQEGPGFVHSVNVTNPAAGTDWSVAVPSGAVWRLISLNAIYAASAAAANRIPLIILQDSNPVSIHEGAPNQVITAGVTTTVTASTTVPPAAANVPNVMVPIPAGALLPQNFFIASDTDNIQAGDQWSSIWLLVEEWAFF